MKRSDRYCWALAAAIFASQVGAQYVYDPELSSSSGANEEAGLACRAQQKPGSFRAAAVQACLKSPQPGQPGRIRFIGPDAARIAESLGIAPGEPAVFMPYY